MISRLLAIAFLLPLCATAQTQVPNVFEDGTPASAAEVNENFEALETGLNQIESAISSAEIDVDCASEKSALSQLIAENTTVGIPKTYRITGTCEVPSVLAFYGPTRILGAENANAALRPNESDYDQYGGSLFWYALDAGSLWLHDITVHNASFQIRRGGVIRLMDVHFENQSEVRARNGGVVVLRGNITMPDDVETFTVYASQGSAVDLDYGLGTRLDLHLDTGSSASCPYGCAAVEFRTLEMYGNTSFRGYRDSDSHLDINNFSLKANSSLIQTRGPCDNPSFSDEMFRDGTSIVAWQPNEGEECNQ